MTILSVLNQKGGVGKTTTVTEISDRIANKGKKVLIIDADPQANLTYLSGYNPDNLTLSLMDVFKGRKIYDCILDIEYNRNLKLIPSTILLSAADRIFVGPSSFSILRKALIQIENIFDYVIIDCPPSLGILTWNSLAASDYVLIPVSTNALSIQGLKALSETVEEVKSELNPNLKYLGLIITRFNSRTNIAKEGVETFRTIASDILNTRLLNNTIRQSVAIENCQLNKRTTMGINSPIAEDYDNATNEIMKYLNQ